MFIRKLIPFLCRLHVNKTSKFTSLRFTQTRSSFLETIPFEDVRLQKHLKHLKDMYIKKEGRNETLICGLTNDILQHMSHLLSDIETTEAAIKELDIFASDLKAVKDDLYNAAISEKKNFEIKLEELKNEALQLIVPVDVMDDKDIIVELSAGVGGQEAMLFTKDMFEMYCSYASWKGWNYEILKYDTTDMGGIRNAHIGINGHNAFQKMKYESGVHRVQRIPKTEKSGRIHTSTMTVAVLPQPTEIDILINPSDIELQFKRSGGAGGQHVNTTDSCVRIYHKPSGIVVECQTERDQHKNRKYAIQSLRAKLYERELEAMVKETKSSRKLQIGTAARSEKVRTYNFPQDRITDHRAHITVHNVQLFLQGEETFDQLSCTLQHWNNVQSLMDILNKYDVS